MKISNGTEGKTQNQSTQFFNAKSLGHVDTSNADDTTHQYVSPSITTFEHDKSVSVNFTFPSPTARCSSPSTMLLRQATVNSFLATFREQLESGLSPRIPRITAPINTEQNPSPEPSEDESSDGESNTDSSSSSVETSPREIVPIQLRQQRFGSLTIDVTQNSVEDWNDTLTENLQSLSDTNQKTSESVGTNEPDKIYDADTVRDLLRSATPDSQMESQFSPRRIGALLSATEPPFAMLETQDGVHVTQPMGNRKNDTVQLNLTSSNSATDGITDEYRSFESKYNELKAKYGSLKAQEKDHISEADRIEMLRLERILLTYDLLMLDEKEENILSRSAIGGYNLENRMQKRTQLIDLLYSSVVRDGNSADVSVQSNIHASYRNAGDDTSLKSISDGLTRRIDFTDDEASTNRIAEITTDNENREEMREIQRLLEQYREQVAKRKQLRMENQSQLSLRNFTIMLKRDSIQTSEQERKHHIGPSVNEDKHVEGCRDSATLHSLRRDLDLARPISQQEATAQIDKTQTNEREPLSNESTFANGSRNDNGSTDKDDSDSLDNGCNLIDSHHVSEVENQSACDSLQSKDNESTGTGNAAEQLSDNRESSDDLKKTIDNLRKEITAFKQKPRHSLPSPTVRTVSTSPIHFFKETKHFAEEAQQKQDEDTIDSTVLSSNRFVRSQTEFIDLAVTKLNEGDNSYSSHDTVITATPKLSERSMHTDNHISDPHMSNSKHGSIDTMDIYYRSKIRSSILDSHLSSYPLKLSSSMPTKSVASTTSSGRQLRTPLSQLCRGSESSVVIIDRTPRCPSPFQSRPIISTGTKLRAGKNDEQKTMRKYTKTKDCHNTAMVFNEVLADVGADAYEVEETFLDRIGSYSPKRRHSGGPLSTMQRAPISIPDHATASRSQRQSVTLSSSDRLLKHDVAISSTKLPWSTAVSQQSIEILRKGDIMVKVGRRGKPKNRFVYLKGDFPNACIVWAYKQEGKESGAVQLPSVRELAQGMHTENFRKHLTASGRIKGARSTSLDPQLCFSLITETRTLDLCCTSSTQFETWTSILRQLISTYKSTTIHEDQATKRSSWVSPIPKGEKLSTVVAQRTQEGVSGSRVVFSAIHNSRE